MNKQTLFACQVAPSTQAQWQAQGIECASLRHFAFVQISCFRLSAGRLGSSGGGAVHNRRNP